MLGHSSCFQMLSNDINKYESCLYNNKCDNSLSLAETFSDQSCERHYGET